MKSSIRSCGPHSSIAKGILWLRGYQRRTQKGIGRNGKIPKIFGTKTQRLYAAGAASAIDMVRFFDIYNKMNF
jgi:hypothetical protein